MTWCIAHVKASFMMHKTLVFLCLLLATASGVETVHYSRRAKHPHDIYILTSVLSEANIALLQCDIQGVTPLTWEQQREFCCNAIMTSSVHVLERSRVPQQCREQSVPVPDISAPTTLPQRQPQLLFLQDHPVQAIPDMNQSVWSYFVWDDIILLGFWLASHDAAQKTSFLQTVADNDDVDDSPIFFTGRIHSSLPVDGGMHRSMQHAVQLDLPSAVKNAESYNVTLWFQWLLPRDVFVLPTDAFEASPYNITMHTVPDRIISEEEAAFGSPPHAVVMELHGQLPRGFDQIEFTSKIHFRYPQPSTDPLVTHRIVSILSPTLVAGQVTAVHSDGTHATLQLQPPRHLRPTSDQSLVMYARVATPQQSDLSFVLATTVLVSMVGAAVIWKETTKTAARLKPA